MQRISSAFLVSASLGLLAFSGCKVGPNYKPPAAVLAPGMPTTFKEAAPPGFMGWKVGEPADAQLKGDWWTDFNDPQLNDLEPEVSKANQTLAAAEAHFRAARAQIGYQRSFEAPTIGVAPLAGAVRNSASQPYFVQWVWMEKISSRWIRISSSCKYGDLSFSDTAVDGVAFRTFVSGWS